MELEDIQIGFNGGLVYRYVNNQLETISERPISNRDSHQLIKHIFQNFPSLSQSYYYKDQWLSFKEDEGLDYESQLTLLQPQIIDISDYLKPEQAIYKIMLITFDPLEMEQVKDNLLQLNLEMVSIQQSGAYYLEITHKDAKKSRGIDYLFETLAITKEETAAFGDGYNDIPMFDKVGTPIAMANAHIDILNQVELVTKSNEEDGVAHGIWQYLKGK